MHYADALCGWRRAAIGGVHSADGGVLRLGSGYSVGLGSIEERRAASTIVYTVCVFEYCFLVTWVMELFIGLPCFLL